jgi:DNA-directed RNA polymerase subunit RPC12/RpoP
MTIFRATWTGREQTRPANEPAARPSYAEILIRQHPEIAMPLYTCPDCGAAVKAADSDRAGARLRCPECDATFRPDDDQPGTADRSSSRAKLRRKQASGRGLMIGLIVGGIALVVIVGGAIGAYFLLRGGGPLGTSLGVNPKCTRDNARKLKAGMTPEQAAQILGDGKTCTASEIIDAVNDSFDHRFVADGPATIGDNSCAVETWYRWQNGKSHAFAGFRKSKTGVDRLVYAQFLHQLGGVFEWDDLVTWDKFNQVDLDRPPPNR